MQMVPAATSPSVVAQGKVAAPSRCRVVPVLTPLVAMCLYQAVACVLLQAQVAHLGARWSSQQALALTWAVVM